MSKKNKEVARLTIIVTETDENTVNVECLHEGAVKHRFFKIGLLEDVLANEKSQ